MPHLMSFLMHLCVTYCLGKERNDHRCGPDYPFDNGAAGTCGPWRHCFWNGWCQDKIGELVLQKQYGEAAKRQAPFVIFMCFNEAGASRA